MLHTGCSKRRKTRTGGRGPALSSFNNGTTVVYNAWVCARTSNYKEWNNFFLEDKRTNRAPRIMIRDAVWEKVGKYFTAQTESRPISSNPSIRYQTCALNMDKESAQRPAATDVRYVEVPLRTCTAVHRYTGFILDLPFQRGPAPLPTRGRDKRPYTLAG